MKGKESRGAISAEVPQCTQSGHPNERRFVDQAHSQTSNRKGSKSHVRPRLDMFTVSILNSADITTNYSKIKNEEKEENGNEKEKGRGKKMKKLRRL